MSPNFSASHLNPEVTMFRCDLLDRIVLACCGCVILFYMARANHAKYEVKCRTFSKCCQTSKMVDIDAAIRWHARIARCTLVKSRLT